MLEHPLTLMLTGAISMSIYSSGDTEFVLTWLYIKKHNITGLKYFGRTTQKDPIKYTGSGKVWMRHIKKHGNDVTTLWAHLYNDINLLKDDAVNFSISHDIVNSSNWANLMIEDGINGSVRGRTMKPHSVETRKKISEAHQRRTKPPIRRPHSEETKEKIRNAIKAKGPRSEETKKKCSKSNKGKMAGELNPFFGKKHSKESIEKMKKSLLARKK
jgi:hypothetical protein